MFAKELAYHRAHFREAVQKDGVICLECGAIFKRLPGHLFKHNLSSDEYKAKWGYNRTTPLETLSTRRKKRRNAIAMKLWMLTPRDAHRRATKAIRGHRWPHRPESRLIQTEAARARLAAELRLAERRAKKSVGKHPKGPTYRRVRPRHRGVNAALDRKILSLRKRGHWPSEIAPLLGIPLQSVYLRLQELKKAGFMIPRPTSLRPNARRKVTNEELLAVARSGLSLREVAVKVGILYRMPIGESSVSPNRSRYSLHTMGDPFYRSSLLHVSCEKANDSTGAYDG